MFEINFRMIEIFFLLYVLYNTSYKSLWIRYKNEKYNLDYDVNFENLIFFRIKKAHFPIMNVYYWFKII